jgi:Rad4 beta-hairpin domain 2/Rad4 beta-hairpin domain 1
LSTSLQRECRPQCQVSKTIPCARLTYSFDLFLSKPKSSYVLERHLLRDQVISQDAHEIGKFRGEPVYSRSQVLQLKAAENWMRHGRVVREGEQPLKYVKQRAATINRRRELEIRAETEGANSGGAVMQGLYAEEQTEVYTPPPVIDVRSSCRVCEGAH